MQKNEVKKFDEPDLKEKIFFVHKQTHPNMKSEKVQKCFILQNKLD